MQLLEFYKNITLANDKRINFKKQVMKELDIKEVSFYNKIKRNDFSPAEWVAIEKIAGVKFDRELTINT